MPQTKGFILSNITAWIHNGPGQRRLEIKKWWRLQISLLVLKRIFMKTKDGQVLSKEYFVILFFTSNYLYNP
jgi:hypothetical protein